MKRRYKNKEVLIPKHIGFSDSMSLSIYLDTTGKSDEQTGKEVLSRPSWCTECV